MAKVNLHITLNGEPSLQQARCERILKRFKNDSPERFVTEHHILIRCVGIDGNRAEKLLNLVTIASDLSEEDAVNLYNC